MIKEQVVQNKDKTIVIFLQRVKNLEQTIKKYQYIQININYITIMHIYQL